MALRGTREKLFQQSNGHFLGLAELFSNFDPLLHEHLLRINSLEISDHYLTKHIQNELIEVIQEKVLKTIVPSVRKNEYYSIILTTPVNPKQIAMILRFVKTKENSFELAERFVGFLPETAGVRHFYWRLPCV